MRWRRIDLAREAVFQTNELGNDGKCRLGHELRAAVFGVASRDGSNRWPQGLDHELSHRISGWGGGQGGSVPWSTIVPPQQGQRLMSWPVRSLRRSCQRRGGPDPEAAARQADRDRVTTRRCDGGWRESRYGGSGGSHGGTVCCRKRRMNSSAAIVMTLVLPSCR
jgi:hypothetical protein